MGLGLASVYGIVKGHKGAIEVKSQPGRGTAFFIYLPASEKAACIGENVDESKTGGTGTVLLADDEETVLEVNRQMLEALGYRVLVANSGRAAIDLYRKESNRIDLVMLDMIMPGLSGGETFDRLREIDPMSRILLCSGYSIDGDAQTILDRGCNGFLQKPFLLEELSRKIREILY